MKPIIIVQVIGSLCQSVNGFEELLRALTVMLHTFLPECLAIIPVLELELDSLLVLLLIEGKDGILSVKNACLAADCAIRMDFDHQPLAFEAQLAHFGPGEGGHAVELVEYLIGGWKESLLFAISWYCL